MEKFMFVSNDAIAIMFLNPEKNFFKAVNVPIQIRRLHFWGCSLRDVTE